MSCAGGAGAKGLRSWVVVWTGDPQLRSRDWGREGAVIMPVGWPLPCSGERQSIPTCPLPVPPPALPLLTSALSGCVCASGPCRCRQAVKRAQEHMGPAAAAGGDGGDGQDEETGGVMHHSYPSSLEREGFVSSSSSALFKLPTSGGGGGSGNSPEFELRSVVGGAGAVQGGGTTTRPRPGAWRASATRSPHFGEVCRS